MRSLSISARYDGRAHRLFPSGCLSYLVNAGAYMDNRNDEGLAALHLAAAGNHAACAELLIKKGADVNIKDTNRYGAPA